MYFWSRLSDLVCISSHVLLQLSSSPKHLTSILQDRPSWPTDRTDHPLKCMASGHLKLKRDLSCTYTGHLLSHYWECGRGPITYYSLIVCLKLLHIPMGPHNLFVWHFTHDLLFLSPSCKSHVVKTINALLPTPATMQHLYQSAMLLGWVPMTCTCASG